MVWSFFTCGHVRVTGDAALKELRKDKERCLVISNHLSGNDLTAILRVMPMGMVGASRLMAKKCIQYLPLGWFLHLHGDIFLNRSAERDFPLIKANLRDWDQNKLRMMVFFPEGTRFSPKKQRQSVAFAVKRNAENLESGTIVRVPEQQHSLLPRVKGFHLCVQELRDHVDCVYDVTLKYPARRRRRREGGGGGGAGGGGGSVLWGWPSCATVHVHVRRIPIAAVPAGEQACTKWLYKLWSDKDQLLQHFAQHGAFPSEGGGILGPSEPTPEAWGAAPGHAAAGEAPPEAQKGHSPQKDPIDTVVVHLPARPAPSEA